MFIGKESLGDPPPIIVPSGTFLDIRLASSDNAVSKMDVHSFWMSFLIKVYTLYSHTVCKANAPISPKKVNALNPMNRRLFLSAKNSFIYFLSIVLLCFLRSKIRLSSEAGNKISR